MNRSAALSRLTIHYRDLLADVAWSEQEITDSLSQVIDDALRLLGYAESDLAAADVAQASIAKYQAALDYTMLQAFANAYSVQVATSVPGPVSVQANQAFSQVSARLALASQRLAALGLDPAADQADGGGWLTLDFLEPGCADEFGG